LKDAATREAGTLVLSRSDVERLLTPDECIAAVQDAFRRHALGQVISGSRPGRTNDDQIIVFDSTGTALQDVAAAAAFYRRAVQKAECPRFAFNARKPGPLP
jgi:ornithine cyclodeaminase/alanine dehydrogenase-like protein (mu-crystallin family)